MGREREGEKHQCARDTSISCLSCAPIGGPACNPGRFPDQELNWWPFSSQTGARFTEPHHSGLILPFLTQAKLDPKWNLKQTALLQVFGLMSQPKHSTTKSKLDQVPVSSEQTWSEFTCNVTNPPPSSPKHRADGGRHVRWRRAKPLKSYGTTLNCGSNLGGR